MTAGLGLSIRRRLCYKEGVEEAVGRVTHFFGQLGVVAVKLTGALQVGDQVRVKGHTTDFTQSVDALQVEHANVDKGGPGEEVAFKAKEKARTGDQVFRVRG